MSAGTLATVATGLAVAACGGGAPQSAGEPTGSFPVQVLRASFPASQTLAEGTNLVISVRNSGTQPIHDIAVTLLNPADGTAAQALGYLLAPQPMLASRSRPAWIIDQPPGPCLYSCRQGGPGGAATAYSNTWALGKLLPGHVATFKWHVTAVQPGTYTIKWEVAAGLNGLSKAIGPGGKPVTGLLHTTISSKPRQAYVSNAGKIVYQK